MIVLLEATVKSSLVLLIGFAALALLRRRSASLRHWVLAVTLTLAAVQPMLGLMLPSWALRDAPLHVPEAVDTQANAPLVSFEVLLPTSSTPGTVAGDSSALVLFVWLSGVVVNVAIMLVGIARLAWLGSRARPAGTCWLEAERWLRVQLRLRVSVRAVVTQHSALLVAWGVLRPTILLPADAESWPADRIRVVMSHEMAHVKRGDWAVLLCAELMRSVYWFNPLVWIACARLRQESEQACDDMVLALGVERTSYATHLVDLARKFSAHGRTWLPAPAVARPSTLQRRVRAMLNSQLNRQPVGVKTRMAIAFAVLCLALPIAGAAMQSGQTVSGTLRDTSGRVLAGATVRLSPVNTETVVQTTTDANGRFRFSAVAVGEHLLSARSAGFAPLRQVIQVGARDVIDLPLTLQVGTLQETITVTSGPAGSSASRVSGGYAQPAPPTCTPSSTGGHIVPPTKLRDVRPRYDERLAGVKGTVILDARIGIDGKVNNIEVFSGVHPDLEDAAIAAVNQWEFSPTYLNCEPVEVRMLVSVTFAGAH
jgi:beta-lactamase regulating signal transducer with metallopeptidase domain